MSDPIVEAPRVTLLDARLADDASDGSRWVLVFLDWGGAMVTVALSVEDAAELVGKLEACVDRDLFDEEEGP